MSRRSGRPALAKLTADEAHRPTAGTGPPNDVVTTTRWAVPDGMTRWVRRTPYAILMYTICHVKCQFAKK
jgi:hypothetical protein